MFLLCFFNLLDISSILLVHYELQVDGEGLEEQLAWLERKRVREQSKNWKVKKKIDYSFHTWLFCLTFRPFRINNNTLCWVVHIRRKSPDTIICYPERSEAFIDIFYNEKKNEKKKKKKKKKKG